MFQTVTPLSPDLTQDERLESIREASNTDRSQTTRMLAHRLRVPEVEIMHALKGDAAVNLNSRGGRNSSVPLSRLAVCV